MTTTELLVTVTGLATIAWINWYFFVAGARVTTAVRNPAEQPSEQPDAHR